jgi:hypothetical protein
MGLLSGLGKLAGGLFGASQADDIPAFSFKPNIVTPSFTLAANQTGNVNLTRTAFPQRFGSELGNLADLRGQVRPGFGRFTEAGVEAIRRARGDALGNARDQLARRRVLGSSFGGAQLASIEQAAGREEAEFRGRAILAEIEATFKIIDQEFVVKTQNFQFELDELGIATNLTQAFMGVLSQQAEIDKEIAAKAATGTGDLFATTFGDIFGGSTQEGGSTLGRLAGTAIGGFFGGPAGATTGGELGAAIG